MKNLKDFDVQNKRVLMRVDFNVPIDEKGSILNDFRIKKALPAIAYLKDKGAKIVLISHLGRPKGKALKRYSLEKIAQRLEILLQSKVRFLNYCVGKKVERAVEKLQRGDIILLENLRFYRGEEENFPEFAKELAKLADIYINNAFSACHRAHASVVGVVDYLPSVAGPLLSEEIDMLGKIIKNPAKPLAAILGGAKIASKAKLIEKFLNIADETLLGGKLANAILAHKGVCIAFSFLQDEKIEGIDKIDLTSSKLHLPVDAIVSLKNLEQDYVRESAIGTVRTEESAFDIGPETIKIFSKIIKQAKTVFWNGPLGMFEDKRFEKGTLSIAKAIIESKAFSLAGGGDTEAFLEKHSLRERFEYVSTGGGAMLEFLAGEKLPGLEALKKHNI